MEKLSRVKKYEDLRKNIEAEGSLADSEMHSDKLSSYANKLNDIDPTVFKKVEVKEETEHKPVRERRNSYFQDDLDAPITSFTNEYLDDFISEVKEYNIKKGNRENEDTEIDILSQLQNVSRKRSKYVEPIQDLKPLEEERDLSQTLSNDDIAKQVQQLLNEEPAFASEVVEPEAMPTMEILPQRVGEKPAVVVEKPVEKAPYVDPMHARLVEETQQLRVQLDEYEGELTDLNEGIDKTNRILNIILCTLVFVLIAVIGVVVYWVVKEGGFLS